MVFVCDPFFGEENGRRRFLALFVRPSVGGHRERGDEDRDRPKLAILRHMTDGLTDADAGDYVTGPQSDYAFCSSYSNNWGESPTPSLSALPIPPRVSSCCECPFPAGLSVKSGMRPGIVVSCHRPTGLRLHDMRKGRERGTETEGGRVGRVTPLPSILSFLAARNEGGTFSVPQKAAVWRSSILDKCGLRFLPSFLGRRSSE